MSASAKPRSTSPVCASSVPSLAEMFVPLGSSVTVGVAVEVAVDITIASVLVKSGKNVDEVGVG